MSVLHNAGYPRLFTKKLTAIDSFAHRDEQSCNQPFLSLTEVTEVTQLPSPLLNLPSELPVADVTALSNFQNHYSHVSDAKETRQEVEAEADTERQAQVEAVQCSAPGLAQTNFLLFRDLPPELRIKIWLLSFLPRVVELHPAWPNCAATVRGDDDNGHQQEQQQQWQSGCNNPAALSVCSEAREIALRHFRVAYPLASITTQQAIGTCAYSGDAIFNEKSACIRRRTLYISPEHDTVALLGQDTYTKLSKLLDSFRDVDPKGRGISNLALSTSGQGYNESATTMRDLDQLTLFTYGELFPPSEWSARGAGLDEQSLASFRKMGNRCELVPCKGINTWYACKLWRRGKGRQFWDEQRKMLQVGKNEMRIQDLEFSDGW